MENILKTFSQETASVSSYSLDQTFHANYKLLEKTIEWKTRKHIRYTDKEKNKDASLYRSTRLFEYDKINKISMEFKLCSVYFELRDKYQSITLFI